MKSQERQRFWLDECDIFVYHNDVTRKSDIWLVCLIVNSSCHCQLPTMGFSKAPSRKHMQGPTDVKGWCLSLSEMFSSLCSHFAYVQAGNIAAFPPVAMTGQLRPSPCLSPSQHCSVLTNKLGRAGHVLPPPELCLLASVFRMASKNWNCWGPRNLWLENEARGWRYCASLAHIWGCLECSS